MPYPEKKDSLKFFPDSQRLAYLSLEMSTAASRLESRFWAEKQEALILKLLETKKQDKLDAAIEYLYKTDMDAYNILLEAVEALSESCAVTHQEKDYDVLLVVAPVLAWTRFTIPSGPLPTAVYDSLAKGLAESVFTDDVRFKLAPDLYAIDQLPYSHTEIFSLMKELLQPVLGKTASISLLQQETASFLADVRYLITSVLVPSSKPVFRWQNASRLNEHSAIRQDCLANWEKQAVPVLSNILHGCMLDLILPDAFFTACRKADQKIRPASLYAAINYLINTLEIPAEDLRAIIGGFSETPEQESITEYRIGFSSRESDQILYGVVWPVYGAEEAQQTLKRILPPGEMFPAQKKKKSPLAQIFEVLEDSKIKCEKNHLERFPMEFCDECTAPLFADINAELVHAELPDSAKNESQLH